MRTLALALAVVLMVGASACSNESETASLKDVGTAWCEYLARCNAEAKDVDNCVRVYLQAAVASGQAEPSSEKMASCVDDLEAATCGSLASSCPR